MDSLDNLFTTIAPIAIGINNYAISAYYHDKTDFKKARLEYIRRDIVRMQKAIQQFDEFVIMGE